MHLEEKVAKVFIKNKNTLTIAESCTGGLVSNLLTNVSGSSAFFWAGIIAYDNSAKIKILKIPSPLIKKHGAVSPEVALAMSQACRKILRTSYGLSLTGIAGPTGGSKDKPVGLVFISLSSARTSTVKKFFFKGTRTSIKQQAAQTALKLLLNTK